ncbi:MAG TPA: aminotransferase class IV [Myxococcota bacterium]|nr:aminotransferase class IV [Myxococcota bacterium]
MAEFQICEALRWEPGQGYFLLERHLRRLAASAAHFGFALHLEGVRQRLSALAAELAETPRKVRLELSANGDMFLEHVDVKPSALVRVALARDPVDSRDEFLRHKTSRRGVYDDALRARPGAQDVLLWNERGELTESCAANLVVELDGQRLTPPVGSGLLPGTFRAELLENAEIREEVLPLKALERASRLFIVNSVRRWCAIELDKPPVIQAQ